MLPARLSRHSRAVLFRAACIIFIFTSCMWLCMRASDLNEGDRFHEISHYEQLIVESLPFSRSSHHIHDPPPVVPLEHQARAQPQPHAVKPIHRAKNIQQPLVAFSEPPTPPPSPPPTPGLSQFLFSDTDRSTWTSENNKMIRELFQCIEQSNCEKNQKEVVILGSYHFRGALAGWTGGEDIWARSTVQALKNKHYTVLYALNLDRAVQLYQMFPQLVKAVLLEGSEIWDCYKDTENCVESGSNLQGIPIWKMFTFSFWAQPEHPLGARWTLSPEPYALDGFAPNTYLGYSIESSCLAHRFVPHHERPNQAYIMAKRLAYFLPGPERAWDPEWYARVAEGMQVQGQEQQKGAGVDVEFVVGASNDPWRDGDLEVSLPEGLVNLGQLPQKEFVEMIAQSKVLIGAGHPKTSPTPYEALCLGVPFINPILRWNEDNKADRRSWDSQHSLLKHMDPPYVYNVHKDDYAGFAAAIKSALETPIERTILERMRLPAIEERLDAILKVDWMAEMERCITFLLT